MHVYPAGREGHPPLHRCRACQAKRRCRFDDDMTGILVAMRECDGLILGSAVYIGTVIGTRENMMDRSLPLRPGYDQEMEPAGKISAGLACAGFRNGEQETALQNIHTFRLP